MMLRSLALACLVAAQQQPAAPPQEIPSPREWVEFSADVRGQGPDGPFEGKFYRGADGSTRKETGPVGGPIRRIVINNLTRGEQYTCIKTCISRPLKSPTTPRRMRLIAGMKKLDKPIEGFEAYLWESGTTQTVIPALNFFAVEMLSEALFEKYSNIRLGKQPSSLFERPPQ